ncbi:uncharacterized protein BDR25DRAFT_317014 [Lindgomyces ingoldianus]|uniref:Uncharacterized protein n=1 Tax=Lindgomyces ingoldianus TaxID=673940 RepID=A0ACB6QL06_9PLEO|nr:uncharacterized protein BDR25DRAFT_317014 [Lindgomyces ingoldianus]KAF2467258.1 hypothetical protein BDR25DRAFT_317014 [Lindgomyces ingoldianus]
MHGRSVVRLNRLCELRVILLLRTSTPASAREYNTSASLILPVSIIKPARFSITSSAVCVLVLQFVVRPFYLCACQGLGSVLVSFLKGTIPNLTSRSCAYGPMPFALSTPAIIQPMMCRIQEDDVIANALAEFVTYAKIETDAALLDQSEVPRSTQYYCTKGRPRIFNPLDPERIRTLGENWPLVYSSWRQPEDLAVLPENVYHMDETGVLLSLLGSLKVLVVRDKIITAASDNSGQ